MTASDDEVLTPIPRDRWQRPLVVPPGGGKAEAYTRCTTFVGCLEDTYNLEKWKMRNVALGLSQRPDLMLSVSAHRDDKDKLNKICDDALEAAKANAAATTGTALHALCEQIDRGLDVGVIPQAYEADLAAYRQATGGMTHHHIERFTVLDDLKIGGTPDRIGAFAGWRGISDIKTGSIDFGMGKIAMQLAVYAHSVGYDHTTRSRFDLGPIDQDVALVIHLPAGEGKCSIVEVDIKSGWEAVQVAREVRVWRSRKDLSRLRAETSGATVADLGLRIRHAPTVEALTQLWIEGNATGAWTDHMTLIATARKVYLDQAQTTVHAPA